LTEKTKKLITMFKKAFLIFSIIAGLLLVIISIIEGSGYYILSHNKALWLKNNSTDISPDDKAFKEIEGKNTELVKKIQKLFPKGIYIVVDTAKNTLYLKNENGGIIRKAVVATGNGNVLTEPAGKKRSWIFDTPRGEFAVKYKINKPTWIKPDWAFIEEGEGVPKTLADRAEADAMGEYALSFGNGFYIHGTLYTRLLGRNATHGCVRVGDDDLIAVNKASTVGTKIFIY
jgi:L,D-transpeptidase ErfK/SrfK